LAIKNRAILFLVEKVEKIKKLVSHIRKIPKYMKLLLGIISNID
jgi:hypothetical protein